MKQLLHVLLILSSVMLLTGCFNRPEPDDPKFAPLPADQLPVAPVQSNASLYDERFSVSLFEDVRARRVGDILTVTLVEQTQASKKSQTTIEKENKTDIKNPTILGKPVQYRKNYNLQFDLESKNDFKGKGDSDQSNKLQGSISVTVIEVLPNSNLVVRGEKWVTLNQGKEFIRLTGIVRQEDIAADNSISSTRVANARITYSGTGQTADANKMGWLARFFVTAFWPF